MKISDLFQRSSNYNAERANDTSRVSADEAARAAPRKRVEAGEDKVSISPMARRFKQVSEIVAEDQENSQARIAALKAQVESGQYSVDSSTVAKSMLSFLKANDA